MTRKKKFSELRANMSSWAHDQADQQAQIMLAQMPLNELRRARGLSQKKLAETLHVQQPSVTELEQSTDMYISMLRSHIEAMGGKLEVLAKFPDGVITINNFEDIEQPKNSVAG